MQQLAQDQQAAAARNAVLQGYINNANAFGAQNQATLGQGISAFNPSRLGADQAARGATISNAIGTGPDTNIPMRAGVAAPVSAEVNKKLGDAFASASGQGGRLAAVGGYGDTLGGIGRDLSTTGERLKTTNNLAAGNMALLPGAQELASFGAYSPIFRPSQPDVPWWASLAKGAGNLLGAASGRGGIVMVALIGRRIPTTGVQGAQAGGLGNVFNAIAARVADPLTPEIRKQQLLGLDQSVRGRQVMADAIAAAKAAGGQVDPYDLSRGGVLSGKTYPDVPLTVGANVFGAASPEATNAAVGAGHPFSGTAAGLQAQEATKLAVAKATFENNLALANNKLVPVPNPEGGTSPVYGRAGEAVGQAIPPSQTVRNQSFWDPNTRQVYQSQDGGFTVQVGSNRVPVAGTGLQPVSNEQAVAQTQDVLTQKTLTPLPAPPQGESRAALAAETASGPTMVGKNIAEEVAGLLGAGTAFPATTEAKNYLTNLVNTTRNTLLAAPGRIAVQAQKWAVEPFPQATGVFGAGINSATQKANVYNTIQHLRDTYETVRQEAIDPNLAPAERQRFAAYLHSLKNTIGMWEAPAAAMESNAPAAQVPTAPAPGGAQAAPAQPERWERVNGTLQRVQ